jgi:hypothetical protein
MSLSLSPNSLYRQTTDCTEGGGLTREHCIRFLLSECLYSIFTKWMFVFYFYLSGCLYSIFTLVDVSILFLLSGCLYSIFTLVDVSILFLLSECLYSIFTKWMFLFYFY